MSQLKEKLERMAEIKTLLEGAPSMNRTNDLLTQALRLQGEIVTELARVAGAGAAAGQSNEEALASAEGMLTDGLDPLPASRPRVPNIYKREDRAAIIAGVESAIASDEERQKAALDAMLAMGQGLIMIAATA